MQPWQWRFLLSRIISPRSHSSPLEIPCRYTVGIRVENDLSRFSAIRLQSTPSVCDGGFMRKCSSIMATKVSKGDVSTVLTKWRETAMLVIDMQNKGRTRNEN